MTNKDQIKTIASEFKWDEKKLLEKLADEKLPEFSAREEFKAKLDAKIQDKIRTTKEQKADQAAMDAVPRKLKWRFYLTWYGYAIVSFVALFLIWFCTNIFTWKLDVPTKYTYLQEKEAFWNLENSQLTYNYDTDRASNFIYDADEDDFDYEEDIIETEEVADNSKSLNFLSKMTETQSLWATINNIENSDELADDDSLSQNYLLNRNFIFNQTYRFAYKDKLFPKLAAEYPIFKSSWILMWSNTPNQVLKNLKIWGVSFKNFKDLEIAGLYIQQNTENWYYISFDSQTQRLHFYPNDSRQAQEFNGKLPSQKQIIKAVEKDLKQIWVSIKNYGDWEIDMENYDESMWIINIFYPFEINWKEVRDAEYDEKIWMQIAYDLNLQKVVSVIWIDIATYDVSNYPTLEKSYIEKEIEKWWEFFDQWALHENSTVVLFDNMEIVYIPKYENWITYYVPAIKWETDAKVENYKWPKHVFQEIVQ
jgi:hypothetical protein